MAEFLHGRWGDRLDERRLTGRLKSGVYAGVIAGLIAGIVYSVGYSLIAYSALSGTPAATFAGGSIYRGYLAAMLVFSLIPGLIQGLVLGLLVGITFMAVNSKLTGSLSPLKWTIPIVLPAVLMWGVGYFWLYRPPPPIPAHGSLFFAYYSPDFLSQMHLTFLLAGFVFSLVYAPMLYVVLRRLGGKR